MSETRKSTQPSQQVVPSMRDNVGRYVELLKEMAGESLAGLTLYGPVLGTEFDPGKMGAQSVLVLRAIDLDFVRRLAEKGPSLGRWYITAPLLMTPEYISRSLDTFPLEMLEIQQQHLTVAGQDHFASVAIQESYLRLQCEREFKVILVRVRQGLLTAAGREDVWQAMAADVGIHLLRTLRGFLWLKGKREALSRESVLAEVERLIGVPLPGVRAAIMMPAGHGWAEVKSLYHDVEKLAQVADEH